MKKIVLIFIGMILTIFFSACSSAVTRESKKNALELRNSIEQIIIIGKTTEFEVSDLLGNPTVQVLRGDGIVRMAYYSGNFYHKNIESNKKILEKYIPSKLLNDEKSLEKVVLGIYLKRDDSKNERIVYKITAEVLRY